MMRTEIWRNKEKPESTGRSGAVQITLCFMLQLALLTACLGLASGEQPGESPALRFVQVAAGSSHTLALTDDGRLFAWGANAHGQLGLGASGEPVWKPRQVEGIAGLQIHKIAASGDSSFLLTKQGELYSWGSNRFGELGHIEKTDTCAPTKVSHLDSVRVRDLPYGGHGLAVTDKGIYSWGSGSLPAVVPELPVTGVAGIASGYGPNLVMYTDGSVWGWGKYSGLGARPAELDLGGRKATMVSLSSILTDDKVLLAVDQDWIGLRGNTNRGEDSTTLPKWAVAFCIPQKYEVSDMFAGSCRFYLKLRDGKVVAWGLNSHGELGTGDGAIRRFPYWAELDAGKVKQIACGDFHTVVLTADGALRACGSNESGQLGFEPPARENEESGVPARVPDMWPGKVISVAVTEVSSMVLLENGKAYTWGWDNYGVLGLGLTIPPPSCRAMPAPVEGNYRFKKVAAGTRACAAITFDGKLVVWGRIFEPDKARGVEASYLSPTIVKMPEEGKIVDVSVGSANLLCVNEAGSVFAWGVGSFGELGVPWAARGSRILAKPTKVPGLEGVRIRTVDAGIYHTLALSEDGRLFEFGEPYHDATPRWPAVEITEHFKGRIVDMSADGFGYACAVDDTGELYEWGASIVADSNNGKSSVIAVPRPISIEGEPRFTRVIAGAFGVFAITADGRAFAWGRNDLGFLGTGKMDLVKQPTAVVLPEGEMVADIAYVWFHTLFLCRSGAVYSAGNDWFCQLGRAVLQPKLAKVPVE